MVNIFHSYKHIFLCLYEEAFFNTIYIYTFHDILLIPLSSLSSQDTGQIERPVFVMNTSQHLVAPLLLLQKPTLQLTSA